MTQVVNFRDVKAHWNAETKSWDSPDFVYIGRANRFYRIPGSKWGNPFKPGRDCSREDITSKYRAYLLNRPDLLAALDELRGKTLVCWCKPLICHGDVLLEMVENPV